MVHSKIIEQWSVGLKGTQHSVRMGASTVSTLSITIEYKELESPQFPSIKRYALEKKSKDKK